MAKILWALITLSLLFINPALAEEDPRIMIVYGPNWLGTAFSVQAPSGKVYLITNKHVCGNEKYLISKHGDTYDVDVVIKVYDKADLCLLNSPINYGFKLATRYYNGEPATATGYPGGERRTTAGVLSKLVWEPYDKIFFLQDTVEAHPGSSGSPLLDPNGDVIGIQAAISVGVIPSYSLAVPLGFIKDFLRNM